MLPAATDSHQRTLCSDRWEEQHSCPLRLRLIMEARAALKHWDAEACSSRVAGDWLV